VLGRVSRGEVGVGVVARSRVLVLPLAPQCSTIELVTVGVVVTIVTIVTIARCCMMGAMVRMRGVHGRRAVGRRAAANGAEESRLGRVLVGDSLYNEAKAYAAVQGKETKLASWMEGWQDGDRCERETEGQRERARL